jgi:DNA-binding NarL/FixJ family response regulator
MMNLALIEDDENIRKAVGAYFIRQSQYATSLFGSVEECLDRMKGGYLPEVIIMDLGLPGMSGLDGIRLIKEKYPAIDIIVFSVFNDSARIFESLCAGAVGYLLKSTPFQQIKEGIEMIKEGGSPMSPEIARQVITFFKTPRTREVPASPLSDKEKEIVVGLVDGLSYKLIADRMDITIETVRFHIKNIYRKLQVHSKGEVIGKSLRGEI